jgi:hypothetical protein
MRKESIGHLSLELNNGLGINNNIEISRIYIHIRIMFGNGSLKFKQKVESGLHSKIEFEHLNGKQKKNRKESRKTSLGLK